jgi:hypothetical protein
MQLYHVKVVNVCMCSSVSIHVIEHQGLSKISRHIISLSLSGILLKQVTEWEMQQILKPPNEKAVRCSNSSFLRSVTAWKDHLFCYMWYAFT